MNDLIVWLRDELQNARLRAETLQAMGGPYVPMAPETARFLREAGDQALAEVEAKRRILDDLDEALANSSDWRMEIRMAIPEAILARRVSRLLALPYADREGYREEWRP